MSDYDVYEPENDPDSDYIIDSIENNEKSIAYGLYCKIRSYHYHYNSVKLKYKLLSSTWFLATFVAFGYLVSGKEAALLVSRFLGVTILGVICDFRSIVSMFFGCSDLSQAC